MNSPKIVLICVPIFAFNIRVPLEWFQDYNFRFNTNETIWGCYLTLSLWNALKCMTGDEYKGSVASINECTTKQASLTEDIKQSSSCTCQTYQVRWFMCLTVDSLPLRNL